MGQTRDEKRERQRERERQTDRQADRDRDRETAETETEIERGELYKWLNDKPSKRMAFAISLNLIYFTPVLVLDITLNDSSLRKRVV